MADQHERLRATMRTHRRSFTDVLANIGTVVITLCLLVTTALFVRARLFASQNDPAAMAPEPLPPPKAVEDWQSLAASAPTFGSESATVRIVVFSDYQCSFCAEADTSLSALVAAHPTTIAVSYRHYPLTAIHAFALPAALAAECARLQGRFTDYHRHLFAAQDALGLDTWREIAARAAVPDLQAFDSCIDKRLTRDRVAGDARAARELGLTGTPSIIVNGMLLPPGAPLQYVAEEVRRQFSSTIR